MARPRERRRRRGWLAPLALAALLALCLLPFGVQWWVKRYVQSDSFRLMLSRKTSQALQVQGNYSPFRWTGNAVQVGSFEASGEGPLLELALRELRATVNFSSWRSEAWDVPEVAVQSAKLVLGKPSSLTAQAPEAASNTASSSPSWLSRWLPSQVKLGQLTIGDAQILGRDKQEFLRDARLSLRYEDSGFWRALVFGGRSQPRGLPEIELESAELHLSRKRVDLSELQAKFLDGARLSAVGDWDDALGQVSLDARFHDLKADKVLRPDWRQRLLGTFGGEISLKASAKNQPWRWFGRIGMKEGTLQALPLLESIADYSRTERFRHLAISELACRFAQEDGRLRLTDILLRSEGLLSVKGTLLVEAGEVMENRLISGLLRVGVARDVLKWLPGAADIVFTESEEGYQWTSMNFGGTLGSPQEDLSPRLKEAAMLALPNAALRVGERAAQEAVDTLKASPGEALLQAPDRLLKTTRGLLEEGSRFVPMLDVLR